MPRSHPLWRCDLCGKGSLDCECNNIGSFNNNNNNRLRSTNNMYRSHPLWRCDLCGKGSLDCECNNIGSFNNNNNNQYGGIKKTKKQ